jgi:hypothetical protein
VLYITFGVTAGCCSRFSLRLWRLSRALAGGAVLCSQPAGTTIMTMEHYCFSCSVCCLKTLSML